MSKDKQGTKKETNVGIKERIQRPRRYKVIMHNDDYTPMDFVVEVLEQIFFKSPPEATRIMLTVHKTGKGIAGVYTKEIADTKTNHTMQIAREHGYPLTLSTEPE